MQKARKLAGGSAAKNKFEIEEHYDDCGTDLSGLGLLLSSWPTTMLLSWLKKTTCTRTNGPNHYRCGGSLTALIHLFQKLCCDVAHSRRFAPTSRAFLLAATTWASRAWAMTPPECP